MEQRNNLKSQDFCLFVFLISDLKRGRSEAYNQEVHSLKFTGAEGNVKDVLVRAGETWLLNMKCEAPSFEMTYS